MKRSHNFKRKKPASSGIIQLTFNFNIGLSDKGIEKLSNEELLNRMLRTSDTKQRAIDSKIDLPEWVFRLALKQLRNEFYKRLK